MNPLNLNGTASNFQYTKALFDEFSKDDIRRSTTFFDVYKIEGGDAAILLTKFMGEMDNDTRRFTNDWPIYRYADLQLLLAEIVTMQGGDPTTYINSIRQRAYGDLMLTINIRSQEKRLKMPSWKNVRKEFVGEGKHWYDIRRMKDGDLAKALQINVTGDLVEKHLLWPIDAAVMSKDPQVEQTPGY